MKLLDCAQLLEKTILYEIKRDESRGDDEGANLKRNTLAMMRDAIRVGK